MIARFLTTLVVAASTPVAAQPGVDTLGVLRAAAGHIVMVGAEAGDSIWPGFRPDTIPLLFVLPGRGTALVGWRGAAPSGFRAVTDGVLWADEADRGAASTSVGLAGRQAAQVVVRALDPVALAGVGVHEAFHVFERAGARPRRRFGGGENSALVSRYPVFDADAETDFALELRLLDDALAVPARGGAAAREMLAVRAGRHRRIGEEMATFDRMAELNEGLAEYALERALRHLAARGDGPAASRAAELLDESRARLRTLIGDTERSVRLRFYSTGPAMAHLLDRARPGWKARLMAENLTLEDALAEAVGYRDAELSLRAAGERRVGMEGARRDAVAAIDRLRARRRAQADSVLARPGVQLIVDAAAMAQHDVGICGFDPQNTLAVSDSLELHMRWMRPCNTSTTFGELNTPALHDSALGTLTAVVGAEEELQLTVAGSPVRLADGERREAAADVRITTPVATYQAGRATLERRGRILRVTLLPR